MLYLVCTSLFDMVLNGVSYQVKGAAYNLNGFNGRLLVGVNSQLQNSINAHNYIDFRKKFPVLHEIIKTKA